MARTRRRGGRTQALGRKRNAAHKAEAQAIALAEDVALLVDWLRDDVLALAGPDHATRREMFDFIVAELRARELLCLHRIGPVVRALVNQRDDLLAFAAQLDRDLAALAVEFQLPVATVSARRVRRRSADSSAFGSTESGLPNSRPLRAHQLPKATQAERY